LTCSQHPSAQGRGCLDDDSEVLESMVDFALPKTSKSACGKTWPKPAGSTGETAIQGLSL